MRTLIIALLSVSLMACGGGEAPAPKAPKKTESIFVLVENGGTISEVDQPEALNTTINLFHQLTTLSRYRATRDTQIHIVLSAMPNRIAWSGTASQLSAQAADVKELLVFKNTFSDLVMAFEQIETTVKLNQPDTIRLYWIGSTIHVPFQSSEKPVEVEVPQEIPDNLALASIADKLNTLKFMRVHADQDQVLQAYLASLGILKRARQGDIDFALLGEAQTKSRLNSLL
ncbi:MAG: hypothetical protein ACRBDL_08835 [Alphaproteobacteria bacterium]